MHLPTHLRFKSSGCVAHRFLRVVNASLLQPPSLNLRSMKNRWADGEIGIVGLQTAGTVG